MRVSQDLKAQYAAAIAALVGDERCKRAVVVVLREWANTLRPRVSVAAQVEAQRRGVDLREMQWRDQPKFDPGRKTFLRKHDPLVVEIWRRCVEAGTAEAIARVLDEMRVTWLLRSEDDVLTRHGFRGSRPANAYVQVGIELTVDGRDVRGEPMPTFEEAEMASQMRQQYPDIVSLPIKVGLLQRLWYSLDTAVIRLRLRWARGKPIRIRGSLVPAPPNAPPSRLRRR